MPQPTHSHAAADEFSAGGLVGGGQGAMPQSTHCTSNTGGKSASHAISAYGNGGSDAHSSASNAGMESTSTSNAISACENGGSDAHHVTGEGGTSTSNDVARSGGADSGAGPGANSTGKGVAKFRDESKFNDFYAAYLAGRWARIDALAVETPDGHGSNARQQHDGAGEAAKGRQPSRRKKRGANASKAAAQKAKNLACTVDEDTADGLLNNLGNDKLAGLTSFFLQCRMVRCMDGSTIDSAVVARGLGPSAENIRIVLDENEISYSKSSSREVLLDVLIGAALDRAESIEKMS